MSEPKRNLLLFLVLLGVAFAAVAGIAGIILTSPERSLLADSLEYIDLARSLQEHGRFSRDPTGQQPELFRTPGYPLFIGLFRPWAGVARLRALLAAQIVLACAAGWLLVSIAVRLGAAPARARLLFPLWLLHPMVPLLACQVVSETLFTFLVVLAGWLIVRALVARSLWPHLGSGILFGAASFVRPIGLVLPPLVLGFLAALHIRSGRGSDDGPGPRERSAAVTQSKRRAPGLAAWTAGALLLPLVWAAHNGVAHGFWGVSKTPVSFLRSAYGDASGGGLGAAPALRTFAEGFVAVAAGPGEWALRRALLGERGQRSPGEVGAEIAIIEDAGGVRFVQRPIEPPAAGRAGARGTGAWLLMLWSWGILAATYLLAAIGLRRELRARRPHAVLWSLLALGLIAASSGPQANARFRAPVLPFVLLLAAPALAAPARTVSRRAPAPPAGSTPAAG